MTPLDSLPPWVQPRVKEMLEDLRERAAKAAEDVKACWSVGGAPHDALNFAAQDIRALPLTPESAHEKEPPQPHGFGCLCIKCDDHSPDVDLRLGNGVVPSRGDSGQPAPLPPVAGEEKGSGECGAVGTCARPPGHRGFHDCAFDISAPSPPNAEQGEDE